ncbi:aKG-HExxH-type peptide beta-hydroxylase [Xanthobacter autotrophicus]|uniref:aKG-HExxH-type peptide beta-hydroxylase n=1 Tax=Xanthobacter autotrophicus TaxID=280 RepID=UPI0024AD2303|nr:HEXXH motif-containing putative peptide modification protein [Xanthobacter autotrophicus]
MFADVRDHRVQPCVFGCYFELVFALKAGRPEEAARLWRRIITLAAQDARHELVPLNEEKLGEDAARICRLLNAGEARPVIGPLDAGRLAAQWQTFVSDVEEALALIDHVDSDLGREVRALVVQIIGAAPFSPDATFGSDSSLMLWGAATLNVDIHRSSLQIAESLVHEAAHLLLFGLSNEEPLVRNPDSQRFSSPLRSDPRPMDGVFHATFVCSRLHLFYGRLLARGAPGGSALDRRQIEQTLAHLASRFDDGAGVVFGAADLTPLGDEVMRAAADYMSHAAAA